MLSGGDFVWRTSDMEILASTCAFFGEVELYLLANAHLKTLPDNPKAEFIKHYNRWLDEYKQKIQQPFYDKDGIINLKDHDNSDVSRSQRQSAAGVSENTAGANKSTKGSALHKRRF